MLLPCDQVIDMLYSIIFSRFFSKLNSVTGDSNMPPLTLLIKPASGMCNLDCTYCFYHDITNKRLQASYGLMTLETLEKIIARAFEFAEYQCTFAFQGGEPTLIGLPYYEKFIELVSIYNTKNLKINFALQTNGYRLEPIWADFFYKHHFLIGISLDGTIHTHNAFRKNSTGDDTFKEVMDTIHMFSDKGVDFNILTVINSKTASSVKKIYAFFKKHKLNYLQFIPCLEPYQEAAGQKDYSLTPEMYGQFLCDLFDLWYEDRIQGKDISIRLFDNYIGILLGLPPESCDMRGVCSPQHVIEADGSIYPCDFYAFDNYKLGNAFDQSIMDMQVKRKELNFIEESFITKPDCKACSFYFLCRGGCKRHRMIAGENDYQDNYFCASYKKFFTYAQERLVKISLSHMQT